MKSDGPLGVPGGEHRLMLLGHPFDFDLPVLPELEWKLAVVLRIFGVELPHVVGVHQPARFIEPAGRRPRIRLIANVPLAERRSLVSRGFHHLSHGGERRIESPCARAMRAEQLRPARIASAEQGGTGRRTDSLRHVKVGEPAPLPRQPFHVGRGILRFAEGPEVGVARIVEKDDDEIRLLPLLTRL